MLEHSAIFRLKAQSLRRGYRFRSPILGVDKKIMTIPSAQGLALARLGCQLNAILLEKLGC